AMARKVIAACDGGVRGKTVALLGLTFKPNTDDMRDSPAISIVTALQDAGAKLNAFDPQGMEQARLYLENLTYCSDAYACCEGASALVIVTEWDAFRALDLERVKRLLAAPVLVDLRNIYDPAEVSRQGFTYVSIGRQGGDEA
ncbi:MAG: UDP-glucose/GDP-mannose dehydrogenase family protein, partial [Beijerinckiaceae bacterium]